jgi:hypothetical protein
MGVYPRKLIKKTAPMLSIAGIIITIAGVVRPLPQSVKTFGNVALALSNLSKD